jgi:enoyl-CoA hydratase/carnithine racemase
MTDNITESSILVENQQAIQRIIINRPDKKNALTHTMYIALTQALIEADDDPQVRVILLTGTVDCFTSGNDLVDITAHPPSDENSPGFRFLTTLSHTKKPIIAAVSGPAVGIGTTLLLHCDLIYASSNARFQLPFVNLGLSPEAGISLLLPLRIGYQRAAELLLLGEPFSAETALALGLINGIYESDKLHTAVLTKAQQLAAQPRHATLLTKALLKRNYAAALDETMVVELRHFVDCLQSPETAAALKAFFARPRST